MGKNNNQRNQKKVQPRYGNPDPMSNVRDMGRYGIKVMRDIARGKFNFYNEGHIFRNLDFCNAIITEVDKCIFTANVHSTAMWYTYANTTDQAVKDIMINDKRTVEAYTLIREVIMQVIASGGDTRYVQVLISKLPRYKYNM